MLIINAFDTPAAMNKLIPEPMPHLLTTSSINIISIPPITSTGRKYSEQTRAKISAAHKGKPKSLEHRAKISATLKGNIPSNKGTKYDASFLVGRQFGAKSTCGYPYKGGTNEYHKWRMANDPKYRESRRLQNQRAKAKRKSAALKYS